ncbi:hypothetical protein HWI77_09290 [Acinetobacter venetianus]|jgi:hypothetical protein|uniref:Lipoprotein n=3 Tax=Acinetobacter venetianus TaxID=52133 RepID=N8YKM5_ACIVR|nr:MULTISPECIES: hypothetical protein [Acinetobacter]MDA0695462.1 hypothetical protein [Pseudomonadota bacterium]ENV37367.1 hypothetical protein F959_02175 [Acinetobacter venetianus RAG-1 = CIP 110063]ERS04084.1 hypothetical protein Q674_08040 [Acinetobacter sp. COS3]KXZ73982.1 hypothetical protein AVENLUH5627_00307 [Acinetobacter venetianus]KXZ74992.1 hypothetical protein AVENLUH8758_00517 [Acinetobacter venetianus]|tara:strand:- start:1312 stop:1677 length:366 start_codon:yes stop_codon:yes gene_type:complete
MMMKKVLLIALGLALVGCAEKKPLTPEEKWHGYCVSVGNAARSITLDRQNGIEQKQATEHAGKIEDETTRKFIFEIIENVYAIPADQLKSDPEALREKLKQEYTDKCLATPHDKLPNYKLF